MPCSSPITIPLKSKDVDEIYSLVRDYICNSGKKVAGLGRDREDIFIGSVAAVGKLMEVTGSRKLFVSGAGVRDGLLFEYILGGKKRIKKRTGLLPSTTS